jgi:hypothetical protein
MGEPFHTHKKIVQPHAESSGRCGSRPIHSLTFHELRRGRLPSKLHGPLHVRFAPKAAVDDRIVIRRFVPIAPQRIAAKGTARYLCLLRKPEPAKSQRSPVRCYVW